jgi:hypothetical protein
MLFVSRCGLLATKRGRPSAFDIVGECFGHLTYVRRRAAECGRSVLFSQHDSDDALGHRRIGRVGRVNSERLIEIIDLEKDRLAVDSNHGSARLGMRDLQGAIATTRSSDPVSSGYSRRLLGTQRVQKASQQIA